MQDHTNYMPVVSDAGTVSHLQMSEGVKEYSHLIYYIVRKTKPLLLEPSPYTIVVDRVYVEDRKFIGLSAVIVGNDQLSRHVKSIELEKVGSFRFPINGEHVEVEGQFFCSFDINTSNNEGPVVRKAIAEYMKFCEWFYSDNKQR